MCFIQYNTVSYNERCFMPRYSGTTAVEGHDKGGEGGVISVTRALLIMEAFRIGERHLTLAELSRRTGLPNRTAL